MRLQAVAILILLLVLCACGRQGEQGVSIDPAFRPLISADANALAGIRFDDLQRSAFYQREQSRLKLPLPDLVQGVSKAVAVWDRKQWILLAQSSTGDLDKKV